MAEKEIANALEDSEYAEIVISIAAVAYLGAIELGYIESDPMLRMAALMIIVTAVLGDSAWKYLKRK